MASPNQTVVLVLQLLHRCLGSFGAQGEASQRGVRLQVVKHRRRRLQLLERAGRCVLCLRRPQRGVGDPSYDPVLSREALQEAHVERRRRRLHRRCSLLLPGGFLGVLGVRQRRRRQHPHYAK